jgi:hypothetical protein
LGLSGKTQTQDERRGHRFREPIHKRPFRCEISASRGQKSIALKKYHAATPRKGGCHGEKCEIPPVFGKP